MKPRSQPATLVDQMRHDAVHLVSVRFPGEFQAVCLGQLPSGVRFFGAAVRNIQLTGSRPCEGPYSFNNFRGIALRVGGYGDELHDVAHRRWIGSVPGLLPASHSAAGKHLDSSHR